MAREFLPWRIALTAPRWLVAAKSLALMIACKERRIPHVMQFLLTTEGKTFEPTFADFRATSAGSELLRRQPDLRALCSNRKMLRACAPGSLGRFYAEFMTVYGLEEEHYLSVAIEQGKLFADDAARAWFHIRVDASHDMRHVLSGYRPDTLGEICLLSFRFAQTRHPGILVLLLLGLLNLMFASRGAVIGPVHEAYKRGRRAKLLDLLPWEIGLDQPLSEHRAALNLTPPQRYPSSFAAEAYVRLENSTLRNAQSQAGMVGENA